MKLLLQRVHEISPTNLKSLCCYWKKIYTKLVNFILQTNWAQIKWVSVKIDHVQWLSYQSLLIYKNKQITNNNLNALRMSVTKWCILSILDNLQQIYTYFFFARNIINIKWSWTKTCDKVVCMLTIQFCCCCCCICVFCFFEKVFFPPSSFKLTFETFNMMMIYREHEGNKMLCSRNGMIRCDSFFFLFSLFFIFMGKKLFRSISPKNCCVCSRHSFKCDTALLGAVFTECVCISLCLMLMNYMYCMMLYQV